MEKADQVIRTAQSTKRSRHQVPGLRSLNPHAPKAPATTAKADTPPVTSPASLPLPVFERIVNFAVRSAPGDQFLYGPQEPPRDLYRLALVARDWREPVREFAAQIPLEKLELVFETGSRAELLAMRRTAQLRGRAVRDVKVKIGFFQSERFFFNPGLDEREVEKREFGWDAIFAHLPGIQRLDLTWIPLESRHAKELLASAAKYCLEINDLVLPRKKDRMRGQRGGAVDSLMVTLHASLERWYRKGTHGGITVLGVPSRNEMERMRSSTAFLDHVARFCPHLKVLTGCDRASFGTNVATSDQLMVPLETWEAFNARCTELIEFNWVMAPFADPYFRVFGQYQKPKLRNLWLTPNLIWDWEGYFEQCSARGTTTGVVSPKITRKPGYGGLATDYGAALKGCPGLTQIVVYLDHFISRHFKNAYVSEDAFGPPFWEAVVKYCPLLKNLVVQDGAVARSGEEVRPTKGLTDASLLAMAGLKHLRQLCLIAAPITGNGVFEFLCRLPTPDPRVHPEDLIGTQLKCWLAMADVEGLPSELPQYHVEILTLLRRLAKIDEKDLGVAFLRHKPRVEITNARSNAVGEARGRAYVRKELKPLVARVMKKHPSLRVQVVLEKKHSGVLHRVKSLLLLWGSELDDNQTFLTEETPVPLEEDATFNYANYTGMGHGGMHFGH